MSTRGCLTIVNVYRYGERLESHISYRKMLLMDGYDAWRCIFLNVGTTVMRRSSYHFVCRVMYSCSDGFNIIDYRMFFFGGSKDQLQQVKDRTLNLYKYDAGNLISKGYLFDWLTTKESLTCLEAYMEATHDPIDLDEATNSILLGACRTVAKQSNWADCDECKLKFKCWTHRGTADTRRLDTRKRK